MKLFLRSKLAALVLVISLVSVITGVALAANSSAPSEQTLTSSVIEITAIPQEVPEGGSFQIVGAGFTPNELVLVEIFIGEGYYSVIIEGGRANDSGAFIASMDSLPTTVSAGVYTVKASTIGSTHVASTPLMVCTASAGKCE